MDRQSIIERVKIKLSEFTPLGEGVSHPLDGYIDPLLDEAAKDLLKGAPIDKLYPVTLDSGKVNVTKNNGVVSIVLLHADVLRPVGVKLSSWSQRVEDFETIGNPKELMQHNKFARGTEDRPVVVYSRKNTEHELTCYSYSGDGNGVTAEVRAIVLQKPHEIHDDLTTSLILLTAAKVAQATEQNELMKTLFELYTTSFE